MFCHKTEKHYIWVNSKNLKAMPIKDERWHFLMYNVTVKQF